MLDEKKIPHVYNVIDGGRHDFKVWKSDLYHFAQLVFREQGQDTSSNWAASHAADLSAAEPEHRGCNANNASLGSEVADLFLCIASFSPRPTLLLRIIPA